MSKPNEQPKNSLNVRLAKQYNIIAELLNEDDLGYWRRQADREN